MMSLAVEKELPVAAAAFGVEQSLSKARWVMVRDDMKDVQDIMRLRKMPELVARILSSRNVALDDVDSFVDPKLAKDFPDPFSLQGMRAFADEICDEIEKGTKFAIFGDFDVDGSTSSAVFIRFFRALGLDIPFYIPDRMKEGYGPNINALKNLQDQGAEYVFINPKRRDDESGLDALAAVGVVYLACVALNNELKTRGYYEARASQRPICVVFWIWWLWVLCVTWCHSRGLIVCLCAMACR